MRLNISRYITITLVLFSLVGCIKNDIPYPTVLAGFESLDADKQVSTATIDNENRTVTINLSEQADLSNVKIIDYKLTGNATLSSDIKSGLDLRKPYKVTVSLYQDYEWTILAKQTIERYFTVQGQIGESVVDFDGKRAVAYVSKNADLSSVKVLTLKLGPADITIMDDVVNKSLDFSNGPQKVSVKYHNIAEQWDLYVENSDVDVDLTRLDAWTNVIWAYGNAEEGKDNGVEYRKAGEQIWQKVPAEWITTNGGSFTACIRHLSAETGYEVRVYSGNNYSDIKSAVTASYFTLPNASFDQWWKDGKIWCPWAQGESNPFWSTGNKGATTLGDSNTFPTTDTWDGGSGYAAELDTKFVGVGSLGKLAAGNLFVGDYVATDGTNGILSFGRKCNSRPTKLTGYWKYKCENISHSSSDYAYLKGRPDTAVIYALVADLPQPFEIRTNPKNRSLIDKNADYVVGYGEITTGQSIGSWTKFTVEFKYKDTSRVPSYIMIVCSASKYGDYFTGGAGSILCVDNFKLEWDY